MTTIYLDPGDTVDITIDWTDTLPSGVTVTSATHAVPSPMTRVAQSATATSTMVRVSGAVHGARYAIEAQATLSNGEVVNRQIDVIGWNA